ncbi:MAG: hypothetical protein ACO2OV_03785 [Thermoproteota archaeon]|jgi:hypothetical protein
MQFSSKHYYFLLSISLILLLLISFFFNISFLSLASYIKEQNPNPPQQNNFIANPVAELRYKLILTFNHDFKFNENFVVIPPNNLANVKVFEDVTNKLVEEKNVSYNKTVEFLLIPNIYRITISLNIMIPSSTSLDHPVIRMVKLNATYTLKIYLQNDTTIENNITHSYKSPDFVEIYDYNGNNLIELDYGELIFVQSSRDKSEDSFINNGFSPQWAVFYLNNLGVFYTRIIPVNPTYFVYLFTNSLLQKLNLDIKMINDVRILTLFLKYEYK